MFFFFVKQRIDQFDRSEATIYQKSLHHILSRPVSVALTLGIFSSGLFLPNRPPILVDLFILALVLPLLDIAFHISGKKSHRYLSVFGLLVLLRFVSYIFPSETLLHRIILLVQSFLELVFLFKLIRELYIIKITGKTFLQFIRLLIFFHLITAFTGLLTNLTAQVRLAKIATDVAITNTLVGLLLIISALTLIGVIQLAIDGAYLQRLNFVRSRTEYLKNLTTRIILFVTALLWIDSIIRIQEVNKKFYGSLEAFLNHEIAFGSASSTLGKILLFFFVIWLSVIVSRITHVVLEDDVLEKASLKKGVPRMISVIVRFTSRCVEKSQTHGIVQRYGREFTEFPAAVLDG